MRVPTHSLHVHQGLCFDTYPYSRIHIHTYLYIYISHILQTTTHTARFVCLIEARWLVHVYHSSKSTCEKNVISSFHLSWPPLVRYSRSCSWTCLLPRLCLAVRSVTICDRYQMLVGIDILVLTRHLGSLIASFPLSFFFCFICTGWTRKMKQKVFLWTNSV